MKVKIGNHIYDASTEPVMVILNDQDKENIKNMHPDLTKYATFPDGWGDVDQMRAWMSEDSTE